MKHNCRRAILSIRQIDKPMSDLHIIDKILDYKLKLEKIQKQHQGVPTEDVSIDIQVYKNEINKCRKRLRMSRPQRFKFKVFVKQYKQETNVEWDYEPNYQDDKKTPYQHMIRGVIDQAIGNIRRYHKPDANLGKFAGVTIPCFGEHKKGRVFAQSGEVLKIYIKRNVQTLYEEKKPILLKKYIGIELEFCAPIKKDELSLKLFRSGIHKYAQLKSDGSLRPHPKEEGFELAILLEEANYKKDLQKITNLLSQIGAKASERRCGFHVHLDMRRRNKELVYSNLVACQYALLSIVDPSRYNNEFCKVVDTRKWPTEFTGDREERYKTINAAAYYKYKTLEVRMHEGSVDYNQITNWVDLLLKITNYSKKLKSDISKLTILQKRIKMKKKLFDYALDRSCRFQVENSEETQEMRSALQRNTPRPLHNGDFDFRSINHTISLEDLTRSMERTVSVFGIDRTTIAHSPSALTVSTIDDRPVAFTSSQTVSTQAIHMPSVGVNYRGEYIVHNEDSEER